MVHARYGEFKVLVDGNVAIDGGSVAFLGVLPSYKRIATDVKERLSLPVIEEMGNSLN